MFDVFHGVDMTIDIDIIIIGVNGAHQLGILAASSLWSWQL